MLSQYHKYLCAFILLHICSNSSAQPQQLCIGHYWSEDEASLHMEEFANLWHDRASWEARADVIRDGIIDGMRLGEMPDVKRPITAEIRDARTMEGYIVENVAIESFPGFFIKGNIYRPIVKKEKYPAILCTHGHKSNRGATKNLQIRCAALARMGAIVFAYHMVGMAEPKQVSHKMPISLLLQTYNSLRVLEYLCSRSDVDTMRIGMTGESGGATQTFVLAALDQRIKVSVPVAQISAHFFGGCIGESGMPIHRSNHHQTNNVEIAALCAPRPQLVISDGADWTKNTPIVEYPYLQKVYDIYDARHKVVNVHLPLEKHDYGYSKRAAAYIFLAVHLDLNLDAISYEDGFHEDFVTILSNEELSIFNNKNPPPADMLMGAAAVIEYLDIE